MPKATWMSSGTTHSTTDDATASPSAGITTIRSPKPTIC